MSRSWLPILLAAASLVADPRTVLAQDSHYWALQNGARATLLGGAVVALEPDLSASFYNPGALARGNDDDALSMFASISTHLELDMELARPVTGSKSMTGSMMAATCVAGSETR